MPQPHMLKISEIFHSFQGEGLRQGEPTLFIRLSGCNLRCSFCDTKYAWKKGEDYSTAEVLNKIRKLHLHFPAEWVCVTGGEPLLQDVNNLVKGLKAEGLKIQVETNATVFKILPVDWYTISPKPERYFYASEYKKKAKEIKLILTKDLGFEVIRRMRTEFPEHIPLILQLQSTRKWSMNLGIKLMRQSLRAGLKNIRLMIQLHKTLGLP